jgi:hypothetical protein
MSNTKQRACASVLTIWTDAVLDGEPVKVSIVNGIAKIRTGGFDIFVPGEFDADIGEVLAAYKRQAQEVDKLLANLPDDMVQSSCFDDSCRFLPISDAELEEQIREFEKQCKVIPMKTRQST